MTASTRLHWLAGSDEQLRQPVLRVVAAVVDAGGAVSWARGATSKELEDWYDDRLADVATGRCRLALALDAAGTVQALGRWQWMTAPVRRHGALIAQVMAHPDARGQGLARLVVGALVDDARAAGVEQLVLEVRGNNHGAESLYRSLGFREVGVLPDAIAVGEHRFDLVTYQLGLGLPPGALRHGRRPEGPGA